MNIRRLLVANADRKNNLATNKKHGKAEEG